MSSGSVRPKLVAAVSIAVVAVVALTFVLLRGSPAASVNSANGSVTNPSSNSTTLGNGTGLTAPPPSLTGGGVLLALGDSVAFGYQPGEAFLAHSLGASVFTSYANYVAQWDHLQLINLACPGETAASMINPSARSAGCENHQVQVPGTNVFDNVPVGYRTSGKLHYNYTGSQLSAAINILKTKNVRLITLDIGANDVLLCQREQHGCTSPSVVAALTAQYSANLRTIISSILATGYKGSFVVLNYYAFNYHSTENAEVVYFDNIIDNIVNSYPGLTLVSGYDAFKAATASSGGRACVAKLLAVAVGATGPDQCDIHPSTLGQQVLANAIETTLSANK
ncbi:MAG: SGNH/GDSL hydrolase family protein [Acidimicrobiaceae bacterium]|nr:SGNH/GDSL hydrolase family protein [Acidimicrobiaceae bacterium]